MDSSTEYVPAHPHELFANTYMQEHAEDHLNVVFLDVDRPTEDLKLMERNSMWGHRVQFLHGSVLVSFPSKGNQRLGSYACIE